MRTEQEILEQSTDERILNAIIQGFYQDKQELDHYKKETDEANKQIKEMMCKLGINDFETDSGLIAKISVSKKESFNNDKLLQKLKSLGITGPIKTIEVVDMEELEDAIYNGRLDASNLTDCREIKETVTLRVTEKKGE